MRTHLDFALLCRPNTIKAWGHPFISTKVHNDYHRHVLWSHSGPRDPLLLFPNGQSIATPACPCAPLERLALAPAVRRTKIVTTHLLKP